METSTFKCPACGSKKQVGHTKLAIDGGVCVYVAGTRREAWKDKVSATSGIAVAVCAECGHISLWAAEFAALREAASKIGN